VGAAVEHYREAMRLDPGSSETAEALARLLAASTDPGVLGPP
jgi:cytochrome c-type biogenesis protein CcmH/NrfG